MEYHVLIIPVIVVAGVGGFVALARALLNNWKASSKGHERADAHQSTRSRAFEKCFNDCMAAKRWDPDRSKDCETYCMAS